MDVPNDGVYNDHGVGFSFTERGETVPGEDLEDWGPWPVPSTAGVPKVHGVSAPE